MKEKVCLKIDGQPVSVENGATILSAAKKLGIEIPTLCHHQELPHFTSCFLCVVEVLGRKNLLPACSTIATEAMEVITTSDEINATRKLCLELLLSDHLGDCSAPCTIKCPAGCDIQGFMASLSRGNHLEAIAIIKEALPIPGALGRICPRPCESQCRRVRVDQPLAIGWLHRYAADQDAKEGNIFTPQTGFSSGKKIAIVGAGPAGISAAYFLRILGHAVTIFEAQEEAGGMLRWGIPAYRLPRAELAEEINAVIQMGVEILFGQRLGESLNISTLRSQYDAVFIATGASLSTKLGIEGEDLDNVFEGIQFLAKAARGQQVAVGKSAIVIGGGNTAVDALRTARRLGAQDVTLLYRRSRAEMPALPVEVEAAEKEGATFHFLAAPLGITASGERLLLRCQKMELGPAGPDGRRKPLAVKGGEFSLSANSIIAAIGQRINVAELKAAGLGAALKDGRLIYDPITFETPLPGIFVGGDAAFNDDKRIAVWAVASGRQAAQAIDRFLMGYTSKTSKEFRISMGADPFTVTPSRFAGIEQLERASMPELELPDRIDSFREVELGFQPEDAQVEAKRCLACGCSAAKGCTIKKLAAKYHAQPERWQGAKREYSVDTTVAGLIFEPGKCINCGICVRLAKGHKDQELFGFVNRGFDSRIKSYPQFVSNPSLLGKKCAEACPTGALTLQENLGKGCSGSCGLQQRG